VDNIERDRRNVGYDFAFAIMVMKLQVILMQGIIDKFNNCLLLKGDSVTPRLYFMKLQLVHDLI